MKLHVKYATFLINKIETKKLRRNVINETKIQNV